MSATPFATCVEVSHHPAAWRWLLQSGNLGCDERSVPLSGSTCLEPASELSPGGSTHKRELVCCPSALLLSVVNQDRVLSKPLLAATHAAT
jgi:hypothetical protein